MDSLYLLAIVPVFALIGLAYVTFIEYYTHKMESDK